MQVDQNRREALLAQAVREGRILASGVPRYRAAYDSDPRGTERTLNALQPVLLDLAAREPDVDAALAEARSLFPELKRGRRGHEGVAQGALAPPSGAFAAPAQADADGYSWPPPTRPEDDNLTVDRNLTAVLFPETRERQSGRVVRAD